MIAALVVLLLFSPLSFIYGRYKARGLKPNHATLRARLIALLPMPLFFAVCMAVAIVWENEEAARRMAELRGEGAASALDTGNGVLDGLLTLARWFGQLELLLFVVAIPYLLGAAIAGVLLVLDDQNRIDLAAPSVSADDQTSDEG
ncbi:hypothetical protein DYI37_16545 [Fulvimarina endophytica]|uniref:Uncharacterized protein n=1 Tax=Fulvimarina endophytica TaxID=2293836 RepID=A0A371WZL5_9HYPH|nr:hypothetical protein [Fulvimarina endophytica]RFC62433.1 hypothetical protein DYI37_16545 [Fulvimarina endophytica]